MHRPAQSQLWQTASTLGIAASPGDGACNGLQNSHRGRGGQGQGADPTGEPDKLITPRHVVMTWSQRLKRVFGVEIDRCTRCGGRLAILASIEEPEVIAKILAHLQKTAPDHDQVDVVSTARACAVSFAAISS